MKASRHGIISDAKKGFSTFILLLALTIFISAFLSGTAFAASTKIISTSATGGDCTTIGTWDAATKTCTMAVDVVAPAGSNGIEIINDGITLDGNGHSVTGSGSGSSTGGSISVRQFVTVKNLTVSSFGYGIYLMSSSRNTIHDNTFANNNYGVYLVSSSTNGIYNNNFIDNTNQAYVSGGSGNYFDVPASGGNYWSSYSTPAQGCDDNNGDFVCDAAYAFTGGTDGVAWRNLDGWKISPPPDSTPPTVSSVLPSGIISTSSTDIQVSYSDAGSNVNLSSVVVTLDGNPLSGCVLTQADATCAVAGLTTGEHTIGGSLADNRGNSATISGGFSFVDSIAPVVTNIQPVGTISTTSTTISADYADGAGSGINTASVSVTLDGNAVAGCVADAAHVSCAVSALSDGNHAIVVSVADNSANTGSGSGSFLVDSTAPAVSNVQPSGTVSSNSANVTASYSDLGSGISTGSVTVTLDGVAMTGCTVTATSVTCPARSLTTGAHTIGGSVSDNAGNVSPISGSFSFIDNIAPALSNLAPTGTISTSDTIIVANFTDGSGSGINTASVTVVLNGNTLTGCTVTATNVSCPQAGLADGSYSFSVGVDDLAGNHGIGTAPFVVDTTGPVVTPAKYINASATGGDCTSIGIWDAATKTCTLTGDYNFGTHNGIEITANGVTLDGNGHTITGGGGNNSGGSLSVKTNVTIKNLTVKSFSYGVFLMASNSNTLQGNTFIGNNYGIGLLSSNNNTIVNNNFSGNANQIYMSGGTGNIFDQAAPTGGNYWSDFDSSGEGCDDADTDGFCDAPYMFAGGQDNLPLVNPLGPPADIIPPNVTGVQPSGTITATDATVAVYYYDLGAGIDTSSVTVRLDGLTLAGCSVSAASATCPVTGLATGAHAISGSLADMSGNVSPISGSFTVETGDTTAPAISNIQPSGTITTSGATVSAYLSDTGSGVNDASVAVYLDGAAMTGCTVAAGTVNCPAAGLANGAHSIDVSVADNAGNTGSASGSFSVAVVGDTVAPAISDIQPAGVITATDASIGAYYSDAGSGINAASVSVTVDSVPVSGCTAAATNVYCPVSGLAQGAHTIGISVADNAGNTGSASGSFTVDTVAPAVSSIQPAGWINTTSSTVTAYLSDATSGVDSASVNVYVVQGAAGQALTGCTVTASSVSCPVSGLFDYGNTLVTIGLRDMAGNVGSASGTFGVDTAAPGILGEITPAGTITTTSAYAHVYLDDQLSGIAAATIQLDGADLPGCTLNRGPNSCLMTGLAEGPHMIGIAVSDNAGNTRSASSSFTVDSVAPAVSNVQPSGTLTTDSATITAYYSDATSGIDAAAVAVYLDDSPTALSGCTVAASDVSCPVSGLANGTHAISVSAADNAGNIGTGTGSFTVAVAADTTAPAINDLMPSGWVTTTSATLSANYSDAFSGINSATASIYLDSAALSGCTATQAGISCPVTGLSEGAHSYTVNVSDNAGNAGSASGSFTVDSAAPAVSNILPSGWANSSVASMSAYYSDTISGVASVAVYLNGVAMNGCTTAASSVYCPMTGLTEPNYTISVSVTDIAGNVGSGSASFAVDIVAPVILDIHPAGTINTTSASVGAYIDDRYGSGMDVSTSSIKLDGAEIPGCTTVFQGPVSCTVSGLSEGAHTLSIIALDIAGNMTTASSTFMVDSIAPSVSNIQPGGTITTDSATISAYYGDTGTGIDSASTAVYLDGSALNGCTVAASEVNCPVTGLPNGNHAISVSVNDNAGNVGSGSGSFAVDVTPADTTAPAVTNIQPSGTIATSSATISAYYSDAESGIDTATVSVYLDGSTLSGCSIGAGSASCGVYGLTDGAHTISVSVADNAGNTGTSTGSFTVSLPPAASCTYRDINGATIDVYSDTAYSNRVCLNDSLSANTTYYMQVTDPATDISGNGSSQNYLRLYSTAATPAQVSFGDGTSSKSFTQTTTSAPYTYRTSFRTPAAADIYNVYVRLADNSSNQVRTMYASIIVGNTAYIHTYSDAAYSQYSDTFSASSTVYVEVYDPSLTSSNIGASTYAVPYDLHYNAGSNITATSVSRPAASTYRMAFRLPATGGDKVLRMYLRNTSSSTFGQVGMIVHVGTTAPPADTTAPSVTNVQPSGTITATSASISAYYSDAESGINSATAAVYLDGAVSALTGCTRTASTISCPVSGLTNGDHAIGVSVGDNAGNFGGGTGSFTVATPGDTTAPSVTNVQPSGTITATSASIGAYYSDADSGIDTASVSVYVDGTALSGCNIGAGSASCGVYGLADGIHTISVSVADNAGNIATGTGSFTVSTGGGSCTTDYTDSNGATIAVYSDSAYTTKVCQQTQLTANTNYYMQITHPNMNLSSEGTRANTMALYNMMNGAVNFGNGSSSATFTQQSGGAPYRYRATFRTPTAAGVYALEPNLQNNAQTKRVYARGWNIRVGSTANYVRTYSDAAYSQYSDTFAAGSTVYMEMYDNAFTSGTPATSQTTVTLGTNWNGGTSTPTETVGTAGTRVYRISFTVPAGSGDKYIYARVRNSGSTTLAYTRILINVT